VVVGILCRSSSWVSGQLPMDEVRSDINNTSAKSARIFCAVSSVSIYWFSYCEHSCILCVLHNVVNLLGGMYLLDRVSVWKRYIFRLRPICTS